MGNEEKKAAKKSENYETLKSLYFSGKVKPSLNKMLAYVKENPKDVDVSGLICKCLERSKNYEELSDFADTYIELAPESGDGYYYKGVALSHIKGKEQDVISNFNSALEKAPDNLMYLKSKGATHYALFTDYHLPIKFAEKHRVKAEESLLKVLELIETKENPDYIEFFTTAEVNVMLEQNIAAKKHLLRAVNAYEATDSSNQDVNIYKEILKLQKAVQKN